MVSDHMIEPAGPTGHEPKRSTDETRRYIAALAASESGYRSILDASPDGIAITDLAGRITLLSTRAAAMWRGARPDDVVGRHILDFLAPEDREPAAGRIAQLFTATMTGTREYRGLRQDGSTFDIDINSGLIRDPEGKPTGMVFVVRDITERKLVQDALRESLEEKESLLKETHHRVKNNLQIINSLLRLEAARSTDNAVKVALGEMQGRVLSMAVLYETLYRTRTFGRLDLARYLKDLARQFFRAHADSAAAARLTLDLAPIEIPIEQGVPCGLILNELMTNSLKYAFNLNQPGEIGILLRREADNSILLRVTDTGPGLPEDFDVRKTLSLGMQLVADLARQIGGSLEVGPGPGARFDVKFHAAAA
jgi:PAS domain S-box-containing protein